MKRNTVRSTVMRAAILPAVVVAGLSLAACDPVTTTQGQLPTVPADIQACFRESPVVVPKRKLTAYDVESLWKQDRVKVVVLRTCGNRFLAWYGDLQKRWR